MYLSDPILYHLTEMGAITPSGVMHPHLWEDLYKISSNLVYVGRGEFRYDRYTVLLQTAYMQSAGAAKPNNRDVQAMYLSAGYSDFGRLSCG
jgi:hypothetical protein